MPKGSNSKLKLPYLQQIMLRETDDEHSLNMNQIREMLAAMDVSSERKSIYSDFQDLEKLGTEIIGEQVGRDYFYHVAGRQFELAELKLLVDAIQSSKFITARKSQELISKLESFASRYEAKKLQRQVLVNGRIKTMNESIYYSVDTIHSAIAQNRQICFQYCEWNVKGELVPRGEGKIYQISPWALAWEDDNYYLIAYDSNPKEGQSNIKHYRVDKMKSISMSEEEREGRELFDDFNMADYSRMSFGMFGGEKKTVKIRFANSLVGVFMDRFGKDISIIPDSAGYSHTNVDVALSPQFYGWLFSLGTGVELLGPQEVVSSMKEYLNKLVKHYN